MDNRFNSAKDIYDDLRKSIRYAVSENIVSNAALKRKAELVYEINRRATELDAVILKHNYMEPVLFRAVNGFSGDSLELSRRAAQTDSDTIVFCGVHFMAQTAKILNPTKKVLIPSNNAGCSLADDITAQDVFALKEKFPRLPVVTYINSTAEVKSMSDICCTSGNVAKVIDWALEKFKTKSLIFVPDKYLAGNIARERNMEVCVFTKGVGLDKEINYESNPAIITWNARCYVHEQYDTGDVEAIRKHYPGAIIMAHPECRPEVVALADFSGSTSKMVEYVRENGKNKMISLLTECSMADNLCAVFPECSKNLVQMRNLYCKHMYTITLDKLLDSLMANIYEVEVCEIVRKKAEVAVRRMLEIN